MFEQILVPVDGSPRAELILSQIGRILRREDARILLVRAIPSEGLPKGSAKLADAKGERVSAETYLRELVRRFTGRGARVAGRVVTGSPDQAILKIADTEHSSMIAMTTHGRTGLSRWIMGSVAEKVVRASEVPVLLVRSFLPGPVGITRDATAEELPLRTILVPTDGSSAAAAAVTPARRFAELFGANVRVLHAEIPLILPATDLAAYPTPVTTPSEADPVTADTAEAFRVTGVPVSRLTALGDPANVILDESQACGAGLIAMATHGRSGISRWMLGSVAERVLRHTTVPILLIPVKGVPKIRPKPRALAGLAGSPSEGK